MKTDFEIQQEKLNAQFKILGEQIAVLIAEALEPLMVVMNNLNYQPNALILFFYQIEDEFIPRLNNWWKNAKTDFKDIFAA